MNLKNKTTKTEFRRLLAACDDQNYSHKLWVHHDGEVRFCRIPIGSNIGPHFDAERDGAKFHLEQFIYRGNYTGPIAVKDGPWVARLYNALVKNWANRTTGFVDFF